MNGLQQAIGIYGLLAVCWITLALWARWKLGRNKIVHDIRTWLIDESIRTDDEAWMVYYHLLPDYDEMMRWKYRKLKYPGDWITWVHHNRREDVERELRKLEQTAARRAYDAQLRAADRGRTSAPTGSPARPTHPTVPQSWGGSPQVRADVRSGGSAGRGSGVRRPEPARRDAQPRTTDEPRRASQDSEAAPLTNHSMLNDDAGARFMRGMGGTFDGGGASGNWDSSPSCSPSSDSSSSSSSDSGSSCSGGGD